MSSSKDWFLELAGKIVAGIGARTNESVGEVLQSAEGLEGLDASLVQIGYAFLPEPIIPASYIERGPYTNPASYKEQMEASVERGWLKAAGQDQYALTEKGEQWSKDFLAKGAEIFGELPMLSPEETERLVELLSKFVERASQTPNVGSLPTLKIGLNLEPSPEAHLMTRLRRKITDVFYYRDDVHIQAWQPYDVDGIGWETLTQVWREEATTAMALAENLSEYRNYNQADYAAALTDLATKGWISEEDEKYVITDKGEEIRQAAEEKTDELFYAPLEAFNDDEEAELKSLMEKMAETLASPEEEEVSSE